MRTLAREEVNDKIRALSTQTKSSLALMIGFFESKTKEEVVASKASPYVMQLAGDIYVAQIQDTHAYFSFGSDSDGAYLMILDVTETRKQPVDRGFFAIKNPKTNSTLNPRFNTSINPGFNTSINPRFNPAYGGPFLYSLDLQQEGFLVRANEQVSIIFDMDSEFTGFTVHHDSGIILTFDTNNEWIGYMVPSGQDPLLRFNQSGDWIGILV